MTATSTAQADGSTPQPELVLGIDIGGSGIKGALVDTRTGELQTERHKILTPQPATPQAVAETAREIQDFFQWDGPVGTALPSVIAGGRAHTAANIDKSWLDTEVTALFSDALGTRAVAVLNDADAAGLAELRFGAGTDAKGTVLLLTFGTGIGSALFRDGILVPNTELGHMPFKETEAELYASSAAKDRLELSYEDWAKRVSRVLRVYEALLWPDLIIVGGGISRKAEKWVPRLTHRTPTQVATFRNNAGIIGAALAAKDPRLAASLQ